MPTDGEGDALERTAHLRDKGVQTGIWWYGDHPTHYAGDAAKSTAETGEQLISGAVQDLVEAVRAIKGNSTAKRLRISSTPPGSIISGRSGNQQRR